MSIFYASRIAASGLRSNRSWMNIISNNVANAHTIDNGQRGGDGNYVPYARQLPVFATVLSDRFRASQKNGSVRNGVEVKGITALKGDVKEVYDPGHPAARRPGTEDAGYVYYPAVSVAQEMADLRVAAASYEANLTVLSNSKKMTGQALQIGRRI